MYKTIKIEKETHKKLLEYISRLQIEKGKRITIGEAIENLLNGK